MRRCLASDHPEWPRRIKRLATGRINDVSDFALICVRARVAFCNAATWAIETCQPAGIAALLDSLEIGHHQGAIVLHDFELNLFAGLDPLQ